MWSHWGSRGPTIEIIEILNLENFFDRPTNEVDVLHLCRALESSNASVYIDLSQTPVSNTGTWETAQTHWDFGARMQNVGWFQVSAFKD